MNQMMRLFFTGLLFVNLGCQNPLASNNELKTKETTSDVGINFSRYRSAWAGCWVPEPGYWNAFCERVISADEAVAALNETGMRKVKLFPPGRSPELEYAWNFPIWMEDLKALQASHVRYQLFVGIPNSALYEVAGVSFTMTCGNQTFTYPNEAFESELCGESADERQRHVMRRILQVLEEHAPVQVSCQGQTFASATAGFDAQVCGLEDINVAVASALVENAEAFPQDGFAAWFAHYMGDSVDAASNLSIEYVGVGNEPLAAWYHDLYDAVLPLAVKKVQQYMDANPEIFSGAKVTVPMAGTFASEPRMAELLLQYLASIKSVFMQNIYPHTDVFSSVLNHVLESQSESVAAAGDAIILGKDQLVFMKDFIAWGSGQATTQFFQNGPTSFYEAYIKGYESMLANEGRLFNQVLDLPVVAGETGWPSSNQRVYDPAAINENFASLVFDEKGETKLSLNTLKQIISNEMFNKTVSGHYTNNVFKYLYSSRNSGYLFQLHDESGKTNEAEGMEFELEPHFGLFELQKDHNLNGPVIDTPLVPKFPIDIQSR